MSQLSELTKDHIPDAVPGYVLSRPRLRDYGATEDAFAAWHVARVARGARNLPPERADKLLAKAEERVASGAFAYPMPAWDAMAISARGACLLFLLSLRVKHPDVTRPEAAKLFVEHEDTATNAILELWGFKERRSDSKKKTRTRRARSTGHPSGASSAPRPSVAGADSPQIKLAT